MKKLVILPLLIGMCGVCQGGVSLRYSGPSPMKDRQPFMFVVSATYQSPGVISGATLAGHRFARHAQLQLQPDWWATGRIGSWGDLAGAGRVGPPWSVRSPRKDRPGNGVPGISEPVGGGTTPPTNPETPVRSGPEPKEVPPGGGDPGNRSGTGWWSERRAGAHFRIALGLGRCLAAGLHTKASPLTKAQARGRKIGCGVCAGLGAFVRGLMGWRSLCSRSPPCRYRREDCGFATISKR